MLTLPNFPQSKDRRQPIRKSLVDAEATTAKSIAFLGACLSASLLLSDVLGSGLLRKLLQQLAHR